MIQHKLSTMPSEQELEQMCARAGISDAQHFFPVETGRNPVIRIVTPARGAFLLKLSPRYGAPVLTHERGAIRTELTAYDLIRSKTNVPIPRVIFSDFSGKCVPCDWFIMEEPEGCPLSRVPRAARQSADILRAVGEAAAQMHAICGEGFGYEQWGFRTNWRDAYLEMTHNIIADAKRFGAEIPQVREVRETIRHFERELDAVKTPSLVHFSLCAEHILIRQENGALLLGAITSPGRAYWGDPAGDLTLLGREESFREGYRAAGGTLEPGYNLTARIQLMQLYLELIRHATAGIRFDRNSLPYKGAQLAARRGIRQTLRRLHELEKG